MGFWMGVAMTLLVESVALIAGRAWLRKKIREVDANELENRGN